MARTDNLYELIKSLTKGEKRNFKLLTQITSSNKKYVKLFDIIDKQEVYDEKKVRARFKGDAFVKQLAVQKNYLYNLILKSLSHYYKKDDGELSTLVFQVKILIDKNLFQHARKLMRKATDRAKDQERFYEYLQLLEYQRFILIQSKNHKGFKDEIRDIQVEENVTLDKVENMKEYRHLWNKSYHLLYSFSNERLEDQVEEVEKLMAHPLMEDVIRAKSTRAKVNYYLLRNLEHTYPVRVPHKINEGAEKVIDLLDQKPAIRQDLRGVYIDCLKNSWIHYHINGHHDKANARLQQMRDFETKSPTTQRMIFEKYHLCGITGCLNVGDVEGGLAFVESFEKELKKYKGKMQKSLELHLYYMSAYFYLIAEMPEKALGWINEFLNEPRAEAFTDLQSLARIMNLVIHYELGNLDLFEYKWKAAHRYIYKRDRLQEFEKAALRYLKRLSQSHSADERRMIFGEMNIELQEIIKNGYEEQMNNQLDLVCWSESRMDRSPWYQVKKDRFDKRVEMVTLRRASESEREEGS